MSNLMTKEQAAQYLGVEVKYLMRQIHNGRGPSYLQPSPKRTLFRQEDLDAYRESWVVVRNNHA